MVKNNEAALKLDSWTDFFDNTTVVFNPLSPQNRVTTVGQLKETLRVIEEIINNLDDAAIGQLYEGSGRDIEHLFGIIGEETYRVLYGDLGVVKDSTMMYLEKLTESVEETLRIENINYFIASTMGDFDIEWYHLEWGQFVMKYNRLCIEAARYLGKSYYFSNAVPIWYMYRYREQSKFGIRPRNDLSQFHRGSIVTNAQDLGIDLLEILKGNIEANPELAMKLLPEGEGRKEGWSKESIRCRNGARLNVKSSGSAFRGRHPGYIIVDDFLKDNVIYSETQRTKATGWFHAVLMNAVSKRGRVCVVGTPFHENDLYGDLKKKKNWRLFEYPAIFPNGRLTNPKTYNYQDILTKKEEQGNLIFSREILCRPILSDSSIFPWEILKRSMLGMENYNLVSNRESFKIKFNKVVTGCDFAMSASVGADSSVFMTFGVTEDEIMYLIHFWRGKGKSFLEQIGVLKGINANFRPDVMCLESNQFQLIFAQEADRYGLPVVADVTTQQNKNNLRKGVPGLAVLFERMKIKFPRGDEYSIAVCDLICSELSSIAFTDKGIQGVGTHDDCAMALWKADVARRRVSGSVLGFLED